MKARFVLVLVFGTFVVSSRLEASTIIFNTSDSQFDAGVDNQGWWSDSASTLDSDDSYTTGDFNNSQRRSFFTFDLSTLNLSTETLVAATLEVVRYDYLSTFDSTETIAFFDVSTPAAVLNANTGTSLAIFNDLGTGTSYGQATVPRYTSSATQTLVFSLNAASLADITAAAGGFFSIGGSLQSNIVGGGTEFLFGTSDGAGIQRLNLETQPLATVPEPSSILLLASGLVAVCRYRGRRRRA